MFTNVVVENLPASLSVPPAFDPISKVVILVDSEHVYEAGDDSGHVLEFSCPYGSQALADSLLQTHKGFVYQPLDAGDTLMNPAAELGDGITISGVSTMLAGQELIFDAHAASRVMAPGQKEIEIEYQFQTKEQQLERKIARTRSMIAKSAEEIRLLVEQEVEGLDKQFTELKVTLDGVTVTDASGTTRIKGSSIETDTLYVNAANILGTLSVGQINMSGAITWNDLSPGVQSTINGAYGDSGLSASEVKTIITEQLVLSPTIMGGQYYDLAKSTKMHLSQNKTATYTYPGLTLTAVDVGIDLFSVGPIDKNCTMLTMEFLENTFLNYVGATNTAYIVGNLAFMQDVEASGTINAMGLEIFGTIDFSNATVTGLDIELPSTVTAVFG